VQKTPLNKIIKRVSTMKYMNKSIYTVAVISVCWCSGWSVGLACLLGKSKL